MNIVSVIIPVYNTAEFLEQCIESVLNQSYQNLEIIIINDCSQDDSKKIMTHYEKTDRRIQSFQFTERKGVGAARNFGIGKATGDYIYFLDSDDYLPPETIDLLVSHIGDNDMIRGKMKSTYLSRSFAVIFKGVFNPKIHSDNRYKLIKNNSALNFLFSKTFIKKNQLAFSEDVEIYSDLYFMIPALKSTDQFPYLREAIYFKRKRNDPVLNPSLNQYDPEDKINAFLKTFMDMKTICTDDLSNTFLDKQLLNFYRKNVVKFFRDQHNIDHYYEPLYRAIMKVNSNSYQKMDWFFKNEIKAVTSGSINKYKGVSERHHFLRDFREGIKSRRKFYIFLYKRVFIKLPQKKDLVFFESFLGRSYSDNPKYIYEYMIQNKMNYKYVWCFREGKEIPGKASQVKRFSLLYFYYLARAKYWVSNSRLPKYLDKRAGNIYLQTWHGTPLKKLVFDIKDIYSADPHYKQNVYMQQKRWDYLNSPNQYSTDIFRRAFKYEKEMLEFGYPRNDILYTKNNVESINEIKGKVGIPLDKKVILYAPTWRDDEFFSKGNYKFTLNMNLDEMRSQLSDDYVLLLRTHYFIANRLDVSEYEGFVYDFSLYDDIAELYLVSDILITDYSSVFFDFANLKRPILYYTYDLEKYRDNLRGLYFDIEKEVPGPLLMTTGEVIQAIQNIDQIQTDYAPIYEEFYEKFCQWDNGSASERTVKQVFKENR